MNSSSSVITVRVRKLNKKCLQQAAYPFLEDADFFELLSFEKDAAALSPKPAIVYHKENPMQDAAVLYEFFVCVV